MNPEVKEAWVTALESGEYKQAKGVLTRVDWEGNESDCCLGVLTKLAVKAGVCQRVGVRFGDNVTYGSPDWTNCALPPDSVLAWAGLKSANPNVEYEGEVCPLADLNDGRGLPFPEIAAIIREQL